MVRIVGRIDLLASHEDRVGIGRLGKDEFLELELEFRGGRRFDRLSKTGTPIVHPLLHLHVARLLLFYVFHGKWKLAHVRLVQIIDIEDQDVLNRLALLVPRHPLSVQQGVGTGLVLEPGLVHCHAHVDQEEFALGIAVEMDTEPICLFRHIVVVPNVRGVLGGLQAALFALLHILHFQGHRGHATERRGVVESTIVQENSLYNGLLDEKGVLLDAA